MLKHSINLVPSRQKLYQAKLLFFLFMASLGMFFAASIITYASIRHASFGIPVDAVPGSIFSHSPEFFRALSVPIPFWLSTGVLVLNSWLLIRAVGFVRRERQVEFRANLKYAWWCAIAFVLVQSAGMSELWQVHFSQQDGSTKIFGMSFALSFIHALHVVGGMAFLGYVRYQAEREHYDHEQHWAVDNCAGYWHFLGVVWTVMLVTFYVLG